MADKLPFLDAEHPIYQRRKAEWAANERRLRGGPDVIEEELTKFKFEDADSHKLRKRTARWPGLPDAHASTLAGWLDRKGPEYTYGPLGPVRPLREIVDGFSNLAEVFHYNCDGIGSDGSHIRAYLNGVEKRAVGCGFRWLLAEMPSLEDLRAIRQRLQPPSADGTPSTDPVDMDAPVSDEEMLAGFRCYLVEYFLEVKNWKFRKGVLQWAVLHIPVEQASDVDAAGEPIPELPGRYLLVRRGYQGLGPRFAVGGWWIFDNDHTELHHTPGWPDTDGEIPLWSLFGDTDEGSADEPARGRSLTFEIGQISADIMNARSEQRYNLRQAAKSITYILGGDENTQLDVVEQLEGESIVVTVKAVQGADGAIVPTIYNSASGAMETDTYATVISDGFSEAREIMVKQVTASPDQSGESRRTDFEAAASPLLARLAANREASDNTMLGFVIKRMLWDPVAQRPRRPGTSSVEWTRDFELRDLVNEIDGTIKAMKDVGLSSPTLEVKSVLERAKRADLLGEDEEAIRDELLDSADVREERRNQEAGMMAELARFRQPGAPAPENREPDDRGPPTPREDEDTTPPAPPRDAAA